MNFLRNHPLISIWIGCISALFSTITLLILLEERDFNRAVLTAGMEAPIGGLYVYLYPDGELDVGTILLTRTPHCRTRYTVKRDSIILDTGVFPKCFPRRYLLVNGNTLETGMFPYHIGKNALMPDSIAFAPKRQVPSETWSPHYVFIIEDLNKYKKKFGRYPEDFGAMINLDGVDRRYYGDALHFTYVPIQNGKSYMVNGVHEKDLIALAAEQSNLRPVK